MTIRHAFAFGLHRATALVRMLALLYGCNFLLAAVAALAFRSTVVEAVGDSLAIDALVRNFDSTVFDDFLHHFGDRIAALGTTMLWLSVVYVLFGVFLGGGILGTLRSGASFTMSSFFEQCGRYFFRFLRLILLLLVIGVLIAGIAGALLLVVFDAATHDATSEKTHVVWGAALFITFLFLLLLLYLIGDYARIDIVLNNRSKVRSAFWGATKFVFRNLGKTLGLQLAFLLLAAVVVGFYWLLEWEIGMTSGMTILFMFLIQQATMIGRTWTRVATFAGELELFQGLTQPKVPGEPTQAPQALLAPPMPVVEPPPKPRRIVRKPSPARKRKTPVRRKKTSSR